MKVEINKRKAAPKIPDRIDIHCEIQAVPFAQLSQMQTGEPSAAIRERVIRARKIQEDRFKPYKGIHSNAMMTERMLHEFAEPDAASLDMLRMAMEKAVTEYRKYQVKTLSSVEQAYLESIKGIEKKIKRKGGKADNK